MTATKPILELTQDQKTRFWSKIDKNGPTMPHMDTPCWVWTACCSKTGYGLFQMNGGQFKAHRIAHVLAGGVFPEGKDNACHKCDNPTCCRASHIFEGSHADNISDRGKKGRTAKGGCSGRYTKPERTARGERHKSITRPETVSKGESLKNSKLTESQVLEIRLDYKKAIRTQKELATKYQVARSLISVIISRKAWKHI